MFRFILLVVLLLIAPTMVATIWIIKDQGVSPEYWQNFELAKVDFDADGIPTLEAENWDRLIEAQGYVIASERLWQMDLMRRAGGGTLSEILGEKTVAHDKGRILEDWEGVAKRGVQLLDEDDKRLCEAYTRGVNRFIKQNSHNWGVEYSILRVEPATWLCKDTLLILLQMANDLTGGAFREANEYRWQVNLTPEWRDFLFPKHHPWAKPIFGKPAEFPVVLPPASQYLPMEKIEDSKVLDSRQITKSTFAIGSNGWAWSKMGGGTFLANDPHLGNSVPQLWFANRLRISASEWVVGVSIPGIPGVVLGMNQSFAWGFTNLGEDVDDYLREHLDATKDKYLALVKGGKEFWRRIVKKKFQLKVKGREKPEEIEAWFTHRGPLSQRPGLGKDYFSRQWLGFREEVLSLPTLKVNRAKSWQEFNEAYDQMRLPAQVALFADRQGNIGLRATGIGVERTYPQRWMVDGTDGEWQGLQAIEARKRVLLEAKEKEDKARYFANGNGQIWEDNYGERWYSEDRRDRIESVLTNKASFNQVEMERLQLDTYSRFHRELVNWLASHVSSTSLPYKKMIDRWQNWNGFADQAIPVFTEAVQAEEVFKSVFLSRIKEKFYSKEKDLPPYSYRLARSWMLAILYSQDGAQAFGIDETDLADFVVAKVAGKEPLGPYPETNRWGAQHPLASIPLLGSLFKVKDYPQAGYGNLIRCEQPLLGASFRAVWNLTDPKESTWTFPVGQSGHVRSIHYRDLQNRWFGGKFSKVLDKNYSW